MMAFPHTRAWVLSFQVPSAAGLCGPAHRLLEGPASALSAPLLQHPWPWPRGPQQGLFGT